MRFRRRKIKGSAPGCGAMSQKSARFCIFLRRNVRATPFDDHLAQENGAEQITEWRQT